MGSNSLTLAALILAGAVISVYGVFRYLDAARANSNDIETALIQASDIRCDVDWSHASGKGRGVVLISSGKARLEYVFGQGSRENSFNSILDRSSGDMYVWTVGATNVVHIRGALGRNDIQEPWWNIATLTNCKPEWYVPSERFELPKDATISER